MINIHRGQQEPSELTKVRLEELPQRRASPAHEITGYQLVKDVLFRDQAGKCCYCEMRCIEASYNDVEHYRPKSTYWWLAWTWDNLMFACPICNRSYKRDQFPLASGSAALVAEQQPPGFEQPFVIDPSDTTVDPVELIEFRMLRVSGKTRWRPFPRNPKDPRAAETIRVCGLDRDGLWEAYADHVNDIVRPQVEDFLGIVATEDEREIVRAWKRTIRRLLSGRVAFLGLSYDALRALVPGEILHRFRLEIPRPPIQEAR